jgi:hypothetical protein
MNLPRYYSPDTSSTWYDTNALGLLGAAIKDAVIKGEMAQVENYTNNLFFAGGFDTPGGYGGSIEFNTPSPLGDRFKWNVGLKIPIDL